MNRTLTLEELIKKHADVFDNPAVQAIVNWRDPVLGTVLLPVSKNTEVSEIALLILMSKR